MSNGSDDSQNVSSGASRRDFLKTSSIVAASGALAGTLNIARSAHASVDDTIRIALIGCGGRGTAACGQALSTAGPVKLIAMADMFQDRMDLSFKELSTKHKDRVDVPTDRKHLGFDAYKKVLEMSDVDMVLLTTPPGFRPIHFEAAVQAGKNIFMEKPVSTDANGIRRVLAAAAEAKKKDLKVGVGLQRHHSAGYIETMKRLHDGVIGDMHTTRIYWDGPNPWTKPRKPGMTEMEYQLRNWYNFTWICGDHIVEQHIHNLDVAHWLKRALPIKANGVGGRAGEKGLGFGEIFDHHAVEFEYADGSRVFSQCKRISGSNWNPVSEYVQGTKGQADISSHRIDVKGKPVWRFKGKEKDAYQVEHDDLFAAVRQGKPYNEAEYAAGSTMMAIIGRMCTYGGNALRWEEALQSTLSVMPKEFAMTAAPPTLPDKDGYYRIPAPGVTKVL
jgi:myo-inositol 2-dehydrogenase/D-chiro-inositol 1-dehydrogenase